MYNPPILQKPNISLEEFREYQKELYLYNNRFAIEELRKSGTPVTWNALESVLCFVGNNHRWGIFCNIIEEIQLTPEAFNKGLAFSYTTGKGDYRAINLFNSSDINIMMSPEDRAFYNELPETVTLYRGTSKDEPENEAFGLSWSTDRGVAEFFAFRFSEENRVVIKLPVKKKYVLTVFTERNEKEILINYEAMLEDPDAFSPVVITESPTSFYSEFIRTKK